MNDFSIQETPAPPVSDWSFLAGDHTAFATAQSGTIRMSDFTEGTHYDPTSKVLPAGVALAKVGSYLVPFDAAASNGAEVLAGFTADAYALQRPNGTLSTSQVIAYLVDAVLIPAKLPVAAHRAIDQDTATTGRFAFRK